MEHEQITTKLWKKTVKMLRVIRGITGEPAVKTVHRLVEPEYQKALDKLPEKKDDDFNAS